MTDKENPYLEMDAKVFEEHMSQVKEALESKKLSTYQFFGESLSEDTENKVKEHASLVEENKTLKEAAETSKTDKMSPETKKLASLTIDSTVNEIKAIDSDFPVESILNNSSLNEFQTIDVLKGVKQMAEYSKNSVESLRKEIGNKQPGTQGYGAPNDSGDADKIVEQLLKSTNAKVE